MSQSEDYLDSLLNSITKAKTDVEQVQEEAKIKHEEEIKKRTSISPDEDFFTATGIDVSKDISSSNNSHPLLRKAFSEEDFLKDFEDELLNGGADAFIDAFEMEIEEEERIFEETGKAPESQSIVDSLLDNIDHIVNNKIDSSNDEIDERVEEPIENISISAEEDASPIEDDDFEVNTLDISLDDNNDNEVSEEKSQADNILDSLDDLSSILNESEDDSDDLSLDSMEGEFEPDELDLLDSEEFGEPNLAGDDLDLDNLLDEDDDLLDIKSILSGDDESFDLDESAEDLDDLDDLDDLIEDSKGKKKKKKKDKKDKNKDGDSKDGGKGFLGKLLTILFGPDDDDDDDEEITIPNASASIDVSEMTDEEREILANLGEGDAAPADAPAPEEKKKEKKKKEKKEKPKKEPKPKKEKPKKEPKPKKEKVPDNSPKIPLPVIIVFLILAVSMIGAFMVGMNYMGIVRHMAQANELYEEGNYIAAYEKLNGFDLSDEEVLLTRNRARVLADLQQCKDEYLVFIDKNLYDFALDSLIKGIGRYEKYKDEAEEYGISTEYAEYELFFEEEIADKFLLSKEEALDIFNQINRHYYTVELRKVLIRLGLEE